MLHVEAFRDELVEWLRRNISAAGARGAVVGLSGGIDSAVVAALCKLAYPSDTLGVIMPCDSDPVDALYAQRLAERLQLEVCTVDLTEIWQSLCSLTEGAALEGKAAPQTLHAARANVKPRLRMTVLYYLAARRNYLVVGTENRAELVLGYSTKYGDGAADLMPIGSLLKREVRALARVLQVPEEIIDRVPTAGLWAGQTDEEEMGVTYSQVDEWLLTGEAPAGVRERLEDLHRRSAHKRALPPIGPPPER